MDDGTMFSLFPSSSEGLGKRAVHLQRVDIVRDSGSEVIAVGCVSKSCGAYGAIKGCWRGCLSNGIGHGDDDDELWMR
eukprot:2351549-Rhodomonas_salina.2